MASSANKTIILKSSDGELFVASETVALQFEKLRPTIEKKGPGNIINVPNVNSSIRKVIEYCQRHNNGGSSAGSSKITDKELEEWDQSFFSVDHQTFLDVMDAAKHLGIPKLADAIVGRI